MSYFIFIKNMDDIDGSIYRIAENEYDLNNLNINKFDYKIIEGNQNDFNNIKYGNQSILKYNENIISFQDDLVFKFNKTDLENYINNFKNLINYFLKSNKNHPLFDRWNNYYNQLNNLNLDTITYPLEKSLEQYFNDLGQPSLNPLQVP